VIIAHATDLTGDDEAAHVHAAALAMASQGQLVSLYAGPPTDERPPTAALIGRWQKPIQRVFRCVQCCDGAADTVIDAVVRLSPAVLVLGTHARRGISALFHESVGEAIARNVCMPTLMVPNGLRGFVDPETGAIDLPRIIVPAGTPEDGERGVAAARVLTGIAGTVEPFIEVVHLPTSDPDAIVHAAARIEASLIVMTTHGHDGVGDVMRGSRTERVLRHAGRPVLVVPVRSTERTPS